LNEDADYVLAVAACRSSFFALRLNKSVITEDIASVAPTTYKPAE
jgi:hypothetical protein